MKALLLALCVSYLAAQNNLTALRTKARQELQAGDYQSSARTAKEALTLQPNDVESLLTYGIALDALKRYREANDSLTAAARQSATPQVLNNLAVNLVHLNRTAEAAATWELVLKADAANASAKYNLGCLDLAAGNWKRALARFEGLPEDEALQGKRAQAHRGYAEQLMRAGKLQESLSEFQTALDIDPNDPAIYIGLSLVLLKSDAPDEAIGVLEKANGRFPGNARTLTALGNAFESKSDWRGAQDWYRQAIGVDSDSAIAQAALGRTLRLGGDNEAGLKILRSAVQAHPNSSAALYELGNALLIANEQDAEGLRLMERTVALAPEKPEPKYLLAKAAAARSDFEAAIRWADQAVKTAPDFAAPHYLLANAYRHRNNTAAAARELAEFQRLESRRKATEQ